MKVRVSTFIVCLLLVTLLPLASVIFIPNTSVSMTARGQKVPVPGTGNFVEDFTTTTYQDLGATSAWGWGTGTVTNSRDYASTPLDVFLTSGAVTNIDVQGRKLYASINSSSPMNTFHIYNITDPMNIQQMSTNNAWSYQRPVVVAGDIAAMGGGQIGPGVGFYNVTNPYQPIVNPFPVSFDGNVTDLEIQGHFLYVANNESVTSQTFDVIDIEDPNNWVFVDSAYLSPFVQGLAVNGHIAYLAEGPAGMNLLNVSDPRLPTLMSTVNTPGHAVDVIIDGSLAFVADGPGGVQIVDVSNPSSANIIGSYDTAGFCRRLALQGDTLYVADSANGLLVLDVADPTHPLQVHQELISFVWDVDLYGGVVVVAGDAGIYTYEIGRGLDNLPLIGTFTGFEIWDIRVRGDVAYVAAGPDGFLTIDVSDPANPQLLDQYAASGLRKLDVQGHIAIAIRAGNIYCFDIRDPTNIQLFSITGGTNLNDVDIHGEYAFVCFGAGGFAVMNITNPYNIILDNQIFEGTNTTAIWVQGYHVYTVDYLGGFGNTFRIYDITDIQNPTRVGQMGLQGYHYDIFVDGDVAIGANEDWLSLRNVTNPFGISLSDNFYDPAHPCLGAWGFGPYVLAARGSGGVRLVNATNVNDIKYAANYTAATMARAVTVHGDYVYVANRVSLLILRLYRSAGDNYHVGTNVATSTTVVTTLTQIENVSVTYTAVEPAGTGISFDVSADGGLNWHAIIAIGWSHPLTVPGNELVWRANIQTSLADRSIHLLSVTLDYEYNDPPSTPGLNDPGTTDTDGSFTVTWSASTDDGTIDHYELQMDTINTFASPDNTWLPTTTSQALTGFTNGTYYFRVRAFDEDGANSSWSVTQDIDVAIPAPPPTTPTTTPTGIPGFPIEAIALGAVFALSFGVLYRRRKRHR